MMEKKITVGEDIKGLIFDIDGTIADSMPVHFLVFQMVGKRYGVDYTKEMFLELAGIPAEVMATSCPHSPDEPVWKLAKVVSVVHWRNKERFV